MIIPFPRVTLRNVVQRLAYAGTRLHKHMGLLLGSEVGLAECAIGLGGRGRLAA
jgi:hypothetical protein